MGNVETAIIEVIKWFRESVRPAAVLCLMSILALVLPQSWLASFGVGIWMQKMHPWIVLVFVGSSLWLATFPIEKAYRIGLRIKYLHDLAPDDKRVLQPYILNNERVHCFSWGTTAG
jgi:Super-infection exclusion protein B